jgi:hypothetical protein
MRWLKDVLTADKDSRVYDFLRVACFTAFVVGLSLQVFVVIARNQPFDFQAFGFGFGAMIAGAGGAMALRKDRESE